MEFIIKHSLRTLVKRGNRDAIEFLKFSADPDVKVSEITMKEETAKIGEISEFSFTVTANKDERLLIDFELFFQSKKGTLTNSKVFKIKQCEIQKGESLSIVKRFKFIGQMTTRTLYPGKHVIEVQVNGKKMQRKEFELVL